MLTLEIEAAQGGFAIVQRNVFIPTPNPVIVVVGESEFVIVPDPAMIDHEPVPETALFAAMVTVPVVQTVCAGPAFAIVGTALLTIVICETELAQGALEMVHANTLVPAGAKPVIVVTEEAGVVITPAPEIFVQTPTPTTGAFAAIVAVGAETQTV